MLAVALKTVLLALFAFAGAKGDSIFTSFRTEIFDNMFTPSAHQVASAVTTRFASRDAVHVPKGWLYALVHQGELCGGVADVAVGISTNTCLLPKKSSDHIVSFVITCSGMGGVLTSFKSTNCDPRTVNHQFVFDLQQCMPTTHGFAFHPVCESESEFALPAPHILRRFYETSTCEKASEFEGVRDGACIATKGGDSMRYQFPTASFHRGVTDCTGPPAEVYPLGPTDVCAAAKDSMGLTLPFVSLSLNATVARN